MAEDEKNTLEQQADPFRSSGFRRIELLWPGKDQDFLPHQDPNGEWMLRPRPEVRSLAPLVLLKQYPQSWSGPLSLVVSGDRLEALNTLARGFAGAIKLAYLDTPRLDVDDKTAVFKGDVTYSFSTWMVVLQAHLRALKPLLSHSGVVVVHTGDLEEPYARLLLDEEFDRENRVATIVWQRAYGPRNMKGMKEFTATHDCLLVYALRKSALPAVGLRMAPDGFSNDDDDPRNEWKAEHKGAHSYRAKSDFETHVSPYHWKIAEGRLPQGLWRLNPVTGAIWGKPEEHGDFPLVIEASDANGKSVRRAFTLKCAEAGTPPTIGTSIPWLFQKFETSGELRITTTSLPDAIVGQEYAVMVFAAGGVPFTAPPKRPGSGRYWEFADDTLVLAYYRDAVYLGKDGKSIPHPKTYAEAVGDTVIKNQMTWWPGREREGSSSTVLAGYTEDATKHLKKLLEIGAVHKVVNTAKPEHLLSRLLEIFTQPGEIALEVFGEVADLCAVALKKGRRFVYLSGESDRGADLFEKCALPRLQAVVDGRDNKLERHDSEIRMRSDAYLPFPGGGGFAVARIGDWLFRRKIREEMPRLNHSYSRFDELRDAILTSQGFLPSYQKDLPDGLAFFENGAAVVIPPDEFLDVARASEIASALKPHFERVTIFYFRSAEEFSPSSLMEGVFSKRVPTEIML